jgi:Zn-dependent peptidase ImmA (M78 family)
LRIPSRLHFPFGYVVRIKLVTVEEMNEYGGEGCDGLWLSDERLILVRKRLTAARKRWIISHEALHAINDWVHNCENRGLFTEKKAA